MLQRLEILVWPKLYKLVLKRRQPQAPLISCRLKHSILLLSGPPMDVFSFAGIILHTFTQQWPAPSKPNIFDPKTRKQVALSEVGRRLKYLDMMTGEGAVLKPLIEECLDEDPTVRPSMVAVCEKIQVSWMHTI